MKIWGKAGPLGARLPLDAAEAVVGTPGVQAIALVHRLWKPVGKASTQAALQPGFENHGKGIAVGVNSDSYDAATVDSSGVRSPTTPHRTSPAAVSPDPVIPSVTPRPAWCSPWTT